MAVALMSNAAPRTIQAVLGCGIKNCSSASQAHEYFKQQFPTSAPAKAAASFLWRQGQVWGQRARHAEHMHPFLRAHTCPHWTVFPRGRSHVPSAKVICRSPYGPGSQDWMDSTAMRFGTTC